MPSSPPSFIRYFAHTDSSELGRAALEYIKPLIRIAPVRLVSMNGGGLEGPWKAHALSLFTPMTGTYVNAVCCHPSRWRWHAVVPMTDGETDAQGLPSAPRVVVDGPPDDRHIEIEMPEPQKITEVAERVEELYTPKVRNVLFMTMPPHTKELMLAAKKYEAVVVPNFDIPAHISREYPDISFQGAVIPIPVEGTGFSRIRELVLGGS